VPDIGDYKDVPVIEVLVKPGDQVGAEDSLITIESDKATMEVPSPVAGVVKEVRVKVGDKVSQGSAVLLLEQAAAKEKPGVAPAQGGTTAPQSGAAQPAAPAAPAARAETPPRAPEQRAQTVVAEQRAPSVAPAPPAAVDEDAFSKAHASPSVRRLAREFGVDLGRVKGSGPKDRVLKEDVQAYVKSELAQPRGGQTGGGFNLPPAPQVDFAKFGPVTSQPLSRIKKISGTFLHRNWVSIPHVTQHDEADVTELEAFRKSQADEAKKQGIRFTILGFLMKASVLGLKNFPEFNASLAADGGSLVLKQYYHIGVAVDTPNGLVVPVIRDVDKKGLLELARELGEVSERMRGGKIAPTDLQGGCFSISSLGGIGGTHFTPIINAPEVAILGVGKAVMKPVWNGKDFAPRLMLPLSLSYDHRVIDGALGARFISFLSGVLGDIRKLVL
ncbi:MAG TPA: dihydrolipoyllysine-residue acetyltransferase, partial [Burkholderiales bacterium]|nr:dihydrolipoyllysine-residue acetyltransferase [Burkholderiales bacterium]